MTFQLYPIAELADSSSEYILDYTYISEENFLLVIALTSEANLLIYHRTLSPKIISVSIQEIYEECGVPQRISITTDASVIVLILSDGDVLMIPIKVLMDVNWGENNSICLEPVRFSISVPLEDGKNFRLPTSVLAFNSRTTNRAYIVYSNKAGHIYFIDLGLQRLIANFSSTDSIQLLELYRSNDETSLLISNTNGAQILLPLENDVFSLRETLAHIIPTELTTLDHSYKYSCTNGYVTALHVGSSILNVYEKMASNGKQNLPIQILKMPEHTSHVYFSVQTLISVANDSQVFLNLHFLDVDRDNPQYISIENKNKVLGFISVVSVPNKLDECVIVTEKTIGWIRTTKSVNELAMSFLTQSYFSSELLVKIASNLNCQPKQMCLTMLRDVLREEKREEYTLNGVIPINEIMGILEEFKESDAILPLLSAKLEKEPSNQDWRKYFFNAWMTKILKLNAKEDESEMQKENLEEELKIHLIKFEVTKEMMSVLLKQSLWSCVAMVLSRDALTHSPTVARFLLELQSWRLVVKTAQLVRCLSFLHWPSVDSFTPTLITKMLAFLPNIQSSAQLNLIVNVAQGLVQKFENAITLYVVSSVRLLSMTSESDQKGLCITPKVLSCGSNCTLSISVEESLIFWGEFSAGNLKMRNEETVPYPKSQKLEKGKSVGVSPTKRQNLKRKYSSITTLMPKTISLPYCHDQDILAYKPQQIACGTEHVLVLTTDGYIFSWGNNRFGQCGVGHNDVVKTPTKLSGSFGRAKSVFAGHYHSGMIDENDEVWLWGWGLYGQLAMECVLDHYNPKRVDSLCTLSIRSMTLGYAHSLFLSTDGCVYGCGSTVYGQLGIDPVGGSMINRSIEMNKCKAPVRIPIPEPVKLISSDYFHGLAVGTDSNTIYQWGACPQSLKMKMFLIKRLRNSNKKGKDSPTPLPDYQKEVEDGAHGLENTNSAAPSPRLPMELSRDYMRVSSFYHWQHKSPITQISAGFNHSALITANGELFTWGKSLDMQLGHGNKKEKDEPCQLMEPKEIQWAQVVAGRSSTTAVTTTGSVYVWGRNDKSQLGLGLAKKTASRKIVLKAVKGQKIVELPDDSCIGQPTQVPGLKLGALQVLSSQEQEQNLTTTLTSTDQHTLNAISRYLIKHPINMFISVHIHLLAGDILSAVDILCTVCEKTNLLKKVAKKDDRSRESPASASLTNSKNSTTTPSSPARTPERNLGTYSSPKRSLEHSPYFNATPTTRINEQNKNSLQPIPTSSLDDYENGNPSNMFVLASPAESVKPAIEKFDDLLDRAWNLLRIHPFREVQTIVLIRMLCAHFPIYHRLAADPRLCRLVDPHIGIISSSIHSSDSLSSRRLMDLTVRERHAALKTARLPTDTCVRAIRQKSDQCAATDRLRFYNECGHYEKCVVETGPGKLEFAALRNKLRKCTKCCRLH